MKKIVNIQEAKTHLSRIVEEVIAGKEIVVAKAGKPMVRLTAYSKPLAPRKGGQFAGRVTEADDCWAPDEDPFDGALDFPSLYRSTMSPLPKVAE